MNTVIKMFVVAGLLAMKVAVAHEHEHETVKPWGIAELKQAQEAALSFVKAEKPAAVYEAIYGFSIERTTQGDAGRARVLYLDGTAKKTLSLFCHVHEGEGIDCH